MKSFPIFIQSLIFVLILAASAFAQTPNSAAMKIGLIDTNVFYDKEKGIREVIAAQEKLDAEFKPKKGELAVLEERIKKIDKELDKFRAAVKEFPQGDYMSLEQTSELYEKLIAEYKQKEEEAKIFYEKRKAEIFVDVYQRVGDAIKQFAKEKSYIIVDWTADDKGMILGDIDDITEPFIKYYNEIYTKLKTQ